MTTSGTSGETRTWESGAPGVLRLPSGRLVRGRGLRHPLPDGDVPGFGVYLLGKQPPEVAWEARWLPWPDFRLPSDRELAREVLREVWERSAGERVEVACGGGRGRTGTALACVAVLDGVPAAEAVSYVREHYDRHAVETPWQRRYVGRFTP
ncbi:protein-tyrosine phosphatase family protein [Streptomyces venezuelae]|uniref:protein-tyrosine phosphatase family protein n=1 Tax=Streptomyces venezuelae TaxID=54571 RepID=UPI0037BAF965